MITSPKDGAVRYIIFLRVLSLDMSGDLVMVVGTTIALWPERSAARTRHRCAPVPGGMTSTPEESF
jgi:hypothetical protein